MQRDFYDILIVGSGAVGLAQALALHRRLGAELSIGLLDTAPARSGAAMARPSGGRAYALAPDVEAFLSWLGLGPFLAEEGTPIRSMTITDSRLNDPVRLPLLELTPDGDGEEPLARIVPERILLNALRQLVEKAGIVSLAGRVEKLEIRNGWAFLTGTGAETWRARLVIGADGANSFLRSLAGISVIGSGYGQTGIVATLAHERAHEGRAVQHFLPEGPFARLPLKGRHCSIVWTLPHDKAQAFLAKDPAGQLADIEARFGHDLGALVLEDEPQGFPLRLQLARAFVSDRLALIGDAAHVVHPLAGQGLNLGFRDAAALAEVIDDRVRLGLDPGDPDGLASYQDRRRHAAFGMAVTTDGLNRLFSNDFAPLRLFRCFGLSLINRIPAAKRQILASARQ